MKAKAIFFTAVNQVEIGETEIPDPGPGEVLVETHFTCISPGTDLRTLAGQQAGADAWPLIPGYSLVGRVCKRGAGATLAEGTAVFSKGTARAAHTRVWGAQVAYAVIPEGAAHVIPDGVDLCEASLAKLAAIALHGARLSKPMPGEHVAVIGLGPIGQLSARMHALSGARVVAADLSPDRVALARQAGVEALVLSGELAQAFATVYPDGADVVVDSTGAPQVLPNALRIARTPPWDATQIQGARLLIQGSYAGDFAVPYGEAFTRELTLLIPRDQVPGDLDAVLGLLHTKRLAIRDLISDVRAPEAAPGAFAELRAAKGALMTVAFAWR
jgi:2-desacetyl-2-hydroxyethyl bacteriochlorophyllide A dehydrogenase